ncbi:MAG: peptidoglycan-binding protein [Piscinibacter sp.]|nr:peptidoglycan-binding protein [Piscinibacter sp.]
MFTTESTRAFEAPALGVATPPLPTPRQYLCWVQRSLSRQGWATPIDGSDSPRYREAVRRFQREHMAVAAPSGTVEPATQDALIRLNHVHPDYTAWTQGALVKEGLLSAAAVRAEPIMERTTSATQRALRKLQGRVGLVPNGWVGSKTELVLMRLAAGSPPGADGRPQACHGVAPPPRKPDDDKRLIQLLREVDVKGLVSDTFLRDEVTCLKSFLLGALAGARVDDRYWQFTPFDALGRERACDYRFEVLSARRHTRPQHALENFRHCAGRASEVGEVSRCLLQVHRAIRCHLNALKNVLTHQAANVSIRDWTECAWMLELRAASQRKSPPSVYRCFGRFLRNASSSC